MHQPDGRLCTSTRTARPASTPISTITPHRRRPRPTLRGHRNPPLARDAPSNSPTSWSIDFHDPEQGGFFFTGTDHEDLIVRQKDLLDNATPSGNALAATALLRLAALTGRSDYEQVARSTLEAASGIMTQYPTAAGQALMALDFLLAPPREIAVIAGDDGPDTLRQGIEAIAAGFHPNQVVAPAPEPASAELAKLVPLLADRPARDGQLTTYICRQMACRGPRRRPRSHPRSRPLEPRLRALSLPWPPRRPYIRMSVR